MKTTQRETKKYRELQDIFEAYEKIYAELSTLKHIIFKATHLVDLEELAVLFSRQIREKIIDTKNAVWFLLNGSSMSEIAKNGAVVPVDFRKTVNITSVEGLETLLIDQMVRWPPMENPYKEMLSEFEAPVLFPLKNPSRALGFFAIDHVNEDKAELCQWLAQFSALMLNIATLHQEIKERNKELEEMTEILFTQQSRLSAIHHTGMEIRGMSDPSALYRKLIEIVVGEFGAKTAILLTLKAGQFHPSRFSSAAGFESNAGKPFSVSQEKILQQSLDTGRIITKKDFPRDLMIGSGPCRHWSLFPLKGQQTTHGILVVDSPDFVSDDALSIMLNQFGLVLDGLGD